MKNFLVVFILSMLGIGGRGLCYDDRGQDMGYAEFQAAKKRSRENPNGL